jgi:hypothetical protein
MVIEDEDKLPLDMRRVLNALRDAAARPDAVVPIRRIANRALNGDAQRAAKVLADLDAAGLIRTDTMGWHRGWLTEKGQRAGLD